MKVRRFFIIAAIAGTVPFAAFVSCNKDKNKPEAAVKVTGISITPATDVTIGVGGTVTLEVKIVPANAANKEVTWESLHPDIATIDVSSGAVKGVSEGTATIRATANDGSGVLSNKAITIEGVLINGIIWATRNVDAPGTFAVNPESSGMLYQWNRRVGWRASNPVSSSPSGQTWNSADVPGSVWATANDPSPAGWRLPTKAELEELVAAGSTWGQRNGVEGCNFGTGANSMFLPAAGQISGAGFFWQAGDVGYYVSSTEGSATAVSGMRIDPLQAREIFLKMADFPFVA